MHAVRSRNTECIQVLRDAGSVFGCDPIDIGWTKIRNKKKFAMTIPAQLGNLIQLNRLVQFFCFEHLVSCP